MSDAQGGMVVSLEGDLAFLPAEVVEAVVRRPVVSPVPRSDVGLALVGGHVVPVLDVGSRRGDLVVCRVGGEVVALSGLVPVESGFFPRSGGGVVAQGREIGVLDVAALVRAAEQRIGSAGQAPPGERS